MVRKGVCARGSSSGFPVLINSENILRHANFHSLNCTENHSVTFLNYFPWFLAHSGMLYLTHQMEGGEIARQEGPLSMYLGLLDMIRLEVLVKS